MKEEEREWARSFSFLTDSQTETCEKRKEWVILQSDVPLIVESGYRGGVRGSEERPLAATPGLSCDPRLSKPGPTCCAFGKMKALQVKDSS